MDARKKARGKLQALRRRLSRSQSYCNGAGQSLQPGASPGGKKAGWGSDPSRRNEKDALADNGNFERLKGQKGQGPSLSAVEDAQSGTGISSRRGAARERDFQRQFESFVRRDDIPEEVKSGVREYLENIHQSQPEEPEGEEKTEN